MDPLEQLTSLAFHQGPAHEANQLIHDVRIQVRARYGKAVNYEVNAMGRTWDYLSQTVAPLLAHFLKSKRMGVKRCEHVFLSLFFGETLYFIRVSDFFEHLRRTEGFDQQTFDAMTRGWERTGRRSVAALPPAVEELKN
jgi:hypothetical protein